MDLRRTLVLALWILLLKLEEDCRAEEGMWRRARCLFLVSLFASIFVGVLLMLGVFASLTAAVEWRTLGPIFFLKIIKHLH